MQGMQVLLSAGVKWENKFRLGPGERNLKLNCKNMQNMLLKFVFELVCINCDYVMYPFFQYNVFVFLIVGSFLENSEIDVQSTHGARCKIGGARRRPGEY
jgi:hypothetical protein